MTLVGNAHRLDTLASRLPVSIQRWLGMYFLLIGLGFLILIDAVWLPRLLFLPPSQEPVAEIQHALPTPVPKKIVATIVPLSPSPRPTTTQTAVPFAPDLPPLIFPKSTAWLSSDSLDTLAKVRTFLEEHPTSRVVLSGHTDDQGTDYLNNSLSLERAQKAHDWLVLHGMDPARIHIQGFGSTDPLLKGHSQEARARNRRVDITFR